MARGHEGLPTIAEPVIIDKMEQFAALRELDQDVTARERILRMDHEFGVRAAGHIDALPPGGSRFVKFNTNPFVLLLYAKQRNYRQVSQIEKEIVPAKLFSSMETAAGRMVEDVTLPIYGWERVASEMHSPNSIVDGQRMAGDVLDYVTLKSGPRCLNDEMAQDLGSDIAVNVPYWLAGNRVSAMHFTYGVLYGTRKLSNKKDWHVIRNLAENLPRQHTRVTSSHRGAWGIEFEYNRVPVDANVRIGREGWTYLGGSPWTFLEVCVALIRACVVPSPLPDVSPDYVIADLPVILDTSCLPADYNVSVLQRSQCEWLLFAARHFCDLFSDEAAARRAVRPDRDRSIGRRPTRSMAGGRQAGP